MPGFVAIGRLATVTDPAQRVSRFTRDARGNLVRIEFPDGAFECFEYDERHLMIAHEVYRAHHLARMADRLGLR